MDFRGKRKVVFIVNPISGLNKVLPKRALIDAFIDKTLFDYDIVMTEYPKHATEIARKASADGANIVVAVGGDGTVNEVGCGLVNTGTSMGIVPCGSGNGLARHLGISMNFIKAIRSLAGSVPVNIDYGTINGHPFFTTCGVGFDAIVSMKFSKGKVRGRLMYLETILKELREYHGESYNVIFDGELSEQKTFLITCANACQWGNDAYIAPEASLCDGYMDVVSLSNFQMMDIPLLAYQLMNKELTNNRAYSVRRCKSVVIRKDGPCYAHYDGDPVVIDGDIGIEIREKGLWVMIPDPNRVI